MPRWFRPAVIALLIVLPFPILLLTVERLAAPYVKVPCEGLARLATFHIYLHGNAPPDEFAVIVRDQGQPMFGANCGYPYRWDELDQARSTGVDCHDSYVVLYQPGQVHPEVVEVEIRWDRWSASALVRPTWEIVAQFQDRECYPLGYTETLYGGYLTIDFVAIDG